MTQTAFKKWNRILSWLAFIIALITFGSSVEPTVSFWDAGEYILTSSKLQVGHPPGAPFFQMMGAFFSVFATDPAQIGMIMNMMSAVASAFTILFMFWTITLLLKDLVVKKDDFKTGQGEAILGAALVGSLAFTFTDSFWFNAVETEVYAMATLIMSVMFYLGLRWERDMHTPRANKWLILIAFITGLSFGVHFMGLLTIPAIGLVYFFKSYKTVTVKNFIIANLVVVGVLAFIFKLLLPTTLKIFGWMEVTVVNTLGLPFHSGTVICGLIVIALFYYGLRETRRRQHKWANTIILCVLFIFIGFSSWLMLPIRANANVIINENDPSSARELLAYYNLEQYPKTYLFYGPQFSNKYSGLDDTNPYIDDKPKYEKDYEKGEYIIVNDYKNALTNYNSDHSSLLPRMWSEEHTENYIKLFTGYLDFQIKPEYRMENELRQVVGDFKSKMAQGQVDYEDYNRFLSQFRQYLDVDQPSFGHNLAYMLEYQFGYMYWRYFMWNFVGRQDDVQGKYDLHGNWISGIKPIDEFVLGYSQDNLPSDVLNNKARNTYYFLPLILGLIGLLFVYHINKKWFWVLLVFFLFTGMAIQFYTNVRPFEPRERDYSVVGSFYVFSIWIGIGVYAIYDLLRKKIGHKILVPAITLICLVLVPGLLASENWDDHDRSGRETAHAMAVKYLESCQPNAILFSIGDNDSFPLWYAQEIEGIRTDVRVVNTSLFQTDWYIDQMKRKAYDSDPIPSQLTHDKYRFGTRDIIMKESITQDTLDIKEFMNFITSENPKTKYKYILTQGGYTEADINQMLERGEITRNYLNSNYMPTEYVNIPVDKESVIRNGIVKAKDSALIADNIPIKISGNALYKNRLLMLDIIANNNWERPIYFTGGAFGDDDYIWLKDYLQLDGLCYKLVPIKTPVDRANPFDMGRVDTETMYEMVKNWDWGNSGDPNIYHDVETRKNGITYRGNLARLIEQLLKEEQFEKAEEIADLAMEKMPVDTFEYYTLLEPYIIAFYEVDSVEKARSLFQQVSKKYQEQLVYFSGLSIDNQENLFEEIYIDIERYRGLVDAVIVNDKDDEFIKSQMMEFNNHLRLFSHFLGEEDLDEMQDEPDLPQDSIDLEPNDSL
ncbi:MAG: DUF2723 domain-containing protein [Flavobacteriaceae bacterium]|nr:DUF2723 domain-containing protein [Flavobacteriaceae bacterium]